MAQGTADALLFVPAQAGEYPAVVVWTDMAGLRPAFADIGRDLAAEGFVVLVPNAFYRSVRLDGSATPELLSFEETRQRVADWGGPIDDAGVVADARAYLDYLATVPQVDGDSKAGMLGYDYGSPYAFSAAAAMPERIGAVAVIHPFRIATAHPNSPHLHVGNSDAAYYVAIARPDDEREPGDKDDLRAAFAQAGLTGEVEIIDAPHGFGIEGGPAFDSAARDAAWEKAVILFRDELQ